MIVPISGQVTGEQEALNVAEVANSNHYGGGIWTERFEKGFAAFNGKRYGVMCNSGSSAVLLALAALELPKGSRVLTCAVNFPTTVNAIIQCGHIPIFVDADPRTLNISEFVDNVDAAIIAHTLGNPVDIPDLPYPVIEDCCDAVGSKINGQMVGHRGVMSCYSFYPAHHITTGEGGMVLTDDPKLKKILESYRDWGRACWCEPGCDNTCGKRYAGDYDHKMSYDRIGYNLKASDFQAAIGVAQLERLPGFVIKRKLNWQYLYDRLGSLPIEIIEPTGDPSWFGFPFLVENRNEFAKYLDSKGIGNRPIMAGNILRQPAYKSVQCEIINGTSGADTIHSHGLWTGVFPGITIEMLDFVIEAFYDHF